MFVAGSAVFKADDPNAMVDALRAAAERRLSAGRQIPWVPWETGTPLTL